MSQQVIDGIQQKYGLTVTEGEVKLMGWDIRRGYARKVKEVSSRISEYLVPFQNTALYLSYDNVDEEIAAALNPIPVDS